jgi:hypothetical protein
VWYPYETGTANHNVSNLNLQQNPGRKTFVWRLLLRFIWNKDMLYFAPVSWQYQNHSTNWSLQLDTITKHIFHICSFLGHETMELHKHYQCFATQVAKILNSVTTEISSLNKITYFHLWLYLPNVTHTSNEVILLKSLIMITPYNTLK